MVGELCRHNAARVVYQIRFKDDTLRCGVGVIEGNCRSCTLRREEFLRDALDSVGFESDIVFAACRVAAEYWEIGNQDDPRNDLLFIVRGKHCGRTLLREAHENGLDGRAIDYRHYLHACDLIVYVGII